MENKIIMISDIGANEEKKKNNQSFGRSATIMWWI